MQLIRHHLRNEFGKGTWARGVSYDREGRVKDVVTEDAPVDGPEKATKIQAKVVGSEDAPYQTSLLIARGLIKSSGCSCPAHGVYDTHCKHVAALTHWIINRGGGGGGTPQANGAGPDPAPPILGPDGQPLPNGRGGRHLRHGKHRQDRNQRPQQGRQQGKHQRHQKIKPPPRPTEPLKAMPVIYVKPVHDGDKQSGITIETALKYKLESGQEKVAPIAECRHHNQDGSWLAPDKRKLIPLHDRVPFLNSLHASKMVYTGNMAVHMMSTLMSSSQAAQIVFDDSLKLEVAAEPLRLEHVVLGPKNSGGSKYRELSFALKNSEHTIGSEELKQMAAEARVSGGFAWVGTKLYTFERHIDWIEARASYDGQVLSPRGQNPVSPADLFPYVMDDEQHPLHPISAFRLGLELGTREFVVDEDWKEYHEWYKLFSRSDLPPLPRVSYGFDLREYQANGLQWLWSLYHRGLAALLADDMGLGKTHQALALLSSLYKSKNHRPELPSLVVAPTSVVTAWQQKLDKYKTGLKWHVFHGKERKIPTTGNDLILTTYGLLQRDPALLKQAWHMVILDEAQAIKNPQTLSAQKARQLQAKFRIIMTGTPVENSMTDLWSLMEFLLPGYLGSFDRFRRLYVPREGMPSNDQAQSVRRLVGPFLLRRTKGQVLLELPEKTEEVRSCGLTEAQQKRYNGYLSTKEVEAIRQGLKGSGKIDYVGLLAILTRLKQVCDHPDLPEMTSGAMDIEAVDVTKTGKWESFEEIIEEALGSGLKVVVFSQYLAVMDLMIRELKRKGVGYASLRGDTVDRGAQLRRFAEDPECKVFVCSLLAGGLGIDLTSASVCIHYDRWWNPAKENQATDRLHRIGQTRGVQVFKLQIPGTIEERISSIIEAKTALADALVEESAVGLKTFSRKELLNLLTQIPEGGVLLPVDG